MNKKTLIIIFGVVVGCILYAPISSAHQSGCHRWHSCPSDSGSYSCGDWGYSNYCGTTTNYVAPVITTKDEISDIVVPYKTITEYDQNEYIGYKKVITPGINGSNKHIVSVTYSNDVESYRGEPSETSTSEPVSEVISIGSRKKPSAYVDYIMDGEEKRFLWFITKRYDIYISGEIEKNYALIRNGKVIELGATNNVGSFVYDNIELNSKDTLEIGTYSGKKFLWIMPQAISVSEKTYVNISKMTVLTEYDKLHGLSSTTPRDTDVDKIICSEVVKNKYIISRDKIEKSLDEISGDDVVIYYPTPCTIIFGEDKK